MPDLNPGDVPCYSAGSTQTSPQGYRKLHSRPGLLNAAIQRWLEIGETLGGRTPLVINAYPASVGSVGTSVSVDSYPSPRVLSRALQLGARERMPTIVCAQSLFLADALLAHIDAGRPLPETMLVISGRPAPRGRDRVEAAAPTATRSAKISSST